MREKLRTRDIIVRREVTVTRNMVTEWWKAVADVLEAYRIRLHQLGNGSGPPPPPITMDLANRLCNLAAELAVGNIPDAVRAVSGRGNPKTGPVEINCVRLAVAYYRACQTGGLRGPDGAVMKVEDANPVATICQWFGVARRTAQGWVKKYPPADFGEVTPRKTSCDEGDDPTWSAEAAGLVFRVKEAAASYQSLSRSQKAYQARDRKRSGHSKKKVRSPAVVRRRPRSKRAGK